MHATRLAILTSPAFIGAVLLLLLNDRVLKPALGTWWTGKLSDVAGVFAFALFWSAFFPQRRRFIVFATALGFVWWKSPLSSGAIGAWNALGVWPLARVVDYTDLAALIVLLPAYRAAQSAAAGPPFAALAWRRATAVLAAATAMLAFAATSTAPTFTREFPPGTEYPIDGARLTVRANFLAHDWVLDSRRHALVDTMSGGGVRLTLNDRSPCGTRLTLLDLTADRDNVDLDSVRVRFETEVVARLVAQFPSCSPLTSVSGGAIR